MVKTALDHGHSVIYGESDYKVHPAYINCTIIDVGIPVYTTKLAWGIQKKSPFYRAFSYHLKKVKEIGAVQRSYKTHKTKHQLCPDYNGHPLSIKQCITAFQSMIAGLVICLLLLLLEILAPRQLIRWFLKTRNNFFKIFSKKHLTTEYFNSMQKRRNSY